MMGLERKLQNIAFLALAGCSGCKQTPLYTLTDEQYAMVGEQIMWANDIKPCAEQLTTYANKKAVFGMESSFDKGLKTALADLDYLYQNNRLYAYDPEDEDAAKDEHRTAFYRPSDDAIAINVYIFDYWDVLGRFNSGMFPHEAAHRAWGGHSDNYYDFVESYQCEMYEVTIGTSIEEMEKCFTSELAEIILAEQDFPSLIDFYYNPIDVVLGYPHWEADAAAASVYSSSGAQEAYEHIVNTFGNESQQAWAERRLSENDVLWLLDYIGTFGLSIDEVHDVFASDSCSAVYNEAQWQYWEYIDKFEQYMR